METSQFDAILARLKELKESVSSKGPLADAQENDKEALERVKEAVRDWEKAEYERKALIASLDAPPTLEHITKAEALWFTKASELCKEARDDPEKRDDLVKKLVEL
ncbi:hypothetical protein F53441_3914 [Fusarium austroafricanum]|uniref:Uncharacterized protein n=1 Tax=Fusarium austroafricanum TaxID=2364996 RepID=A0A8H4KLH5_9HYPO|nr:hypothetical protein F53441_3914 [Fusarium austroafricanum]